MVIPESAGDKHRLVVKALFLVAEHIGDDPQALDPADRMLYQDSDARLLLVPFLLGFGQIAGAGFSLGHGDGMAGILLLESLETQVHMLPDVRGHAAGRRV